MTGQLASTPRPEFESADRYHVHSPPQMTELNQTCDNCGDRPAIATRTPCLDGPELDDKRVKTLELCRPCTDAFDWGSGIGPIGLGLPERPRSTQPEDTERGPANE